MQRNVIVGSTAALAVVFFWSGWIIVSRFGVTSTLTLYDITGLRFAVGALVVLPWVVWKRTWRGLTPGRVAVLAIGSGVPYALLSYYGFYFAPAAHGGVFLNGCLPIFTALVTWWWLKIGRSPLQITGLAVIIIGVVLVGWDGLIAPAAGSNDLPWLGDLFFLSAIILFAFFMVGTNIWGITPGQVVFSVAFIGGIYYVPFWLLFLESNLAAAPWSEIILQGAYQGLVPSVFGISCLSIAIKNIGANAASVFLSAVPVLGGLAGYFILGEEPGSLGWLGMVVVTGGVLLALGLKAPGSTAARQAQPRNG